MAGDDLMRDAERTQERTRLEGEVERAVDPAVEGPERWLLLIHQLPAKPAYLRVKIWRRLADIGAVAIKNG